MTDNVRAFAVTSIAVQQPAGEGFSILDASGASVATFAYATHGEADEAKSLIEAAVAKAIDIRGYDAALATTIIPLDKLDASNDE